MWDAESDETKAEVQAIIDRDYPASGAKNECNDGGEVPELGLEGSIESDDGLTPADAQKYVCSYLFPGHLS